MEERSRSYGKNEKRKNPNDLSNMETRDKKIENGLSKIETKLKELDEKKAKLPAQKISTLATMSDSDLALKWLEMDRIEADFAAKKAVIGIPEITISGKTPTEWKDATKLQIEINQINREKRDLQERKKALEKHFTEDHVVDQLLAGL